MTAEEKAAFWREWDAHLPYILVTIDNRILEMCEFPLYMTALDVWLYRLVDRREEQEAKAAQDAA